MQWATQSKDPVLTRYGVGSLARLTISGGDGAALVAKCGGLEALVKSLGNADGQTVCYAAKAAGMALGLNPTTPLILGDTNGQTLCYAAEAAGVHDAASNC